MATHFFHSGMVGAPTNTNAAGSTLAIIRAVLSTGFNLLTPQSATVAGGVMTLGYSAPHGYEDKVLLRLDGAPGGSVVRRVTSSAGSSSLTIPAPGFADGAVSGSLSTRVAPAGWEEVFTGAGVGVFRSTVIGPGSTRFFYRVADTAISGTPRILRGYESMTNVDAGIGPFPTVAQEMENGGDIYRSSSSTARTWAAVADGRTVYICLAHTSNSIGSVFWFGDEEPISSSDLFCAACGARSARQLFMDTYYKPRPASGSGTSQQVSAHSPDLGAHPYPSTVDGGLLLVRPMLGRDGNGTSIPFRSVLRGALRPTAMPIPSGSVYLVMPSVPGVSGRVAVFMADANSSLRAVAFAIDEDWP